MGPVVAPKTESLSETKLVDEILEDYFALSINDKLKFREFLLAILENQDTPLTNKE